MYDLLFMKVTQTTSCTNADLYTLLPGKWELLLPVELAMQTSPSNVVIDKYHRILFNAVTDQWH
jgi:hypothetical protein